MSTENPLRPRTQSFNIWLGQKGVLRNKPNFSNKVLGGWADDFLNSMNLKREITPSELVADIRSLWGAKGVETKRRKKQMSQTPRMIKRRREAAAKADLDARQGDLF